MPTGKKVAHKAGKQMHSRRSTPAQKTMAGSDLAQRPRKRTAKK
jgi:hypothetical protein